MNIFEIQKELIQLFDQIEEAGGEITPAQEDLLAITEENFKNKVKDYVNIIKILNNQLNGIKEEQDRLKNLTNRKKKLIEKLEKVVLDAIINFGETRNGGVKYIDYDTGIVSTRKSTNVEIDNDCVENITIGIKNLVDYYQYLNELDIRDSLNIDDLKDFISRPYNFKDSINNTETLKFGHNVTEGDLMHTTVTLKVDVPVRQLIDGRAYNLIKVMNEYNRFYDILPNISKSEIKKDLLMDGSCAPNIAKLQKKTSLTIK